jgi:crotonobetainyl-CoA:carnitine CoA-transferase CaiB-like acyl-CoA transferase
MIQLLEGVRVLECAVLVQGGHTGRLFGDLGATIVKVENPKAGDYIRDIGGVITPKNSPYHLLHNRNKRSITLDLRTDDGREIFWELLKDADIFVDGFAGSACERLGIGYEAQRQVKPDIIYLQSSGFGARGPYAEIPVHGYMMMAQGGALHLEMCDDGFVRQTPDPDAIFSGTFSAPIVGALYGALTALAALKRRDLTGEGAFIDSSGTDATIALRGAENVARWNEERITDATAVPNVGHPDSPKYDFYETKDGKFVVLAAIEPKFWRNFCTAVDRPDLAAQLDETYAVDFSSTGGPELATEIQKIFHTRTRDEWMTVAREHDIAMGPANQAIDILDDEHVRAREAVYESVHPQAGRFVTVGWPAPVAGQPFGIEHEAPLLGEHTDEILGELGRTEAEVAGLHERGIV